MSRKKHSGLWAATIGWVTLNGAAYASPGELDPAFGDHGRAWVDIVADDTLLRAPADLLPDGRIVVAGKVRDVSNAGGVAVAKIHSDGSLDPTFGNGGISRFDDSPWRSVSINTLAASSEGRILLAGRIDVTGNSGTPESYGLVARLNSDGSLDRSFADGGSVRLAPLGTRANSVHSIAIQPDGRIIVLGQSAATGQSATSFLVRLLADGTPDGSFGNAGVIDVGFPATALAIGSDGAIHACGGAPGRPSATRFRADGARDLAFGNQGTVSASLAVSIHACAVRPNGQLAMAGASGRTLVVMQLAADGAVDASFGNEGVATLSFGCSVSCAFPDEYYVYLGVTDMLALPNGDLVLAGANEGGETSIARLDSRGRLDPSFGRAGVTLVDGGRATSIPFVIGARVLRQADGRLVVATVAHPRPVVARLLDDESPGAALIGLPWLGHSRIEGTTLEVIVRRSGSARGPASVMYATFDGTARAPDDYAAATGTIVWADGDFGPKSISIQIAQDGFVEGVERFGLELRAPSGAGLAASQTDVAILDAPPPSSTPSPPTPDGRRGGGGSVGLMLAELFCGLLARRRRRPAPCGAPQLLDERIG